MNLTESGVTYPLSLRKQLNTDKTRLIKATEELMNTTIYDMPILESLKSVDDSNVVFTVNSEFLGYVFGLKKFFARIDADAYLNLGSQYSLRLYEMFCSFRSKGRFYIRIDKLKSLLCISEEMPTKRLLRDIVKPALENITAKSGVNITINPSKSHSNNKTITHLEFQFNPF
jgi:plasmid replication initiation protein